MQRRQFFKITCQSILAIAMASCRSNQTGGGGYGSSDKIVISLPDKDFSYIRIMDLNDFSFQEFVIPAKQPHSILQLSGNSDYFFVLDLMGDAYKIVPETGEVQRISNSEKSRFFGHGAISEDGKYFWCTELVNDKGTIVRKRRAEDLSIVEGENSSFKGGHHVIRLPGSPVYVSGGSDFGTDGGGYITSFNSITGELKTLSTKNEIVVHLQSISSTEYYATSVLGIKDKAGHNFVEHYAPSHMLFGNLSGEVIPFWDESHKDYFKYNFGIVQVPGKNNTYITSHVQSDKIILWNGFKMLKDLDVEAPMNLMVTRNSDRLVVQADCKIQIYSMTDFKLIKEFKYDLPVDMLSAYI